MLGDLILYIIKTWKTSKLRLWLRQNLFCIHDYEFNQTYFRHTYYECTKCGRRKEYKKQK